MEEQILIVEDENDTAELLQYNLEKMGYRILRARSGEEGMESVQREAPDLVLLDVLMPELSGWEVCTLLRESSNGKTIPIIMLSALGDEEARLKGLSLGANDYITKPFSVKEVLLKVDRHIKERQVIKEFQVREQEQDTSLRYLVHELTNALTLIGGYSALALGKGENAKYLQTIRTSAFYAESVLKDAALLTRLEKNAERLPVEPLDISILVRDVIAVFDHTTLANHAEILMVNAASSIVLAHHTGLKQVLINLISNAAKYNRDKGRIWIQFEETDNLLDVSITDEGKGISQAELPNIFAKYYRVAGNEAIKGLGMGLYIVRLMINAMGGTITATSSLGSGSTFTISLPRPRRQHTAIFGAVIKSGISDPGTRGR